MAFCVCFYELNGITISPSLEKVVSVETVHQIVLAGWSQLEHVPVVPGISPGLKEWVLGRADRCELPCLSDPGDAAWCGRSCLVACLACPIALTTCSQSRV